MSTVIEGVNNFSPDTIHTRIRDGDYYFLLGIRRYVQSVERALRMGQPCPDETSNEFRKVLALSMQKRNSYAGRLGAICMTILGSKLLSKQVNEQVADGLLYANIRALNAAYPLACRVQLGTTIAHAGIIGSDPGVELVIPTGERQGNLIRWQPLTDTRMYGYKHVEDPKTGIHLLLSPPRTLLDGDLHGMALPSDLLPKVLDRANVTAQHAYGPMEAAFA